MLGLLWSICPVKSDCCPLVPPRKHLPLFPGSAIALRVSRPRGVSFWDVGVTLLSVLSTSLTPPSPAADFHSEVKSELFHPNFTLLQGGSHRQIQGRGRNRGSQWGEGTARKPENPNGPSPLQPSPGDPRPSLTLLLSCDRRKTGDGDPRASLTLLMSCGRRKTGDGDPRAVPHSPPAITEKISQELRTALETAGTR